MSPRALRTLKTAPPNPASASRSRTSDHCSASTPKAERLTDSGSDSTSPLNALRGAGLEPRVAHYPVGLEQSAAIASTTADPDSVLPALQAAGRSGLLIITFNSGVEFGSQGGSRFHGSLDETSAGEMAGEQFKQASVRGTMLCVIHELDNVGLDARCNGLEATYTSEIEILHLDESLDDSGRASRIVERLMAEEPPAGILTLNGNVLAGRRVHCRCGRSTPHDGNRRNRVQSVRELLLGRP